MYIHRKARTTPLSRLRIVEKIEAGAPVSQVAREAGISRQTAYKWLRRWRAGDLTLDDRAPVAKFQPRRVPHAIERAVEELRRVRRLLAWQIARTLGLARSTVIKVLRRLGLSRLSSLELPELKVRYEYAEPGQLVHIDIKKLGKFAEVGHRIHGDRRHKSRYIGWEYVYVCIDDASRIGYVEIRSREDRTNAAMFMRNAIMWFATLGISIERVLSDNGKVFRCFDFLTVLNQHEIRHLRTRPYRPCTNGKAERFIQTLLREWAYAIAYETSEARKAALPAWLDYYNQERPHSALKQQAPLLRLGACKQSAWS